MMDLTVGVSVLPGVGEQVAKKLARLEIQTIGDLLTHYPRRYEDWTDLRPIRGLRIGEQSVTIRGELTEINNERSPRRHMAITKATVRDASGELSITWFNQSFLTQNLHVGTSYYFHGTVGFDSTHHRMLLTSPDYATTPRVVPIYPETAGLSSKQLNKLILLAWRLTKLQPDFLPTLIQDDEALPTWSEAIRAVHFPESLREAADGRKRLAFDELYIFSLQLRALKQEVAALPAVGMTDVQEQQKRFNDLLPFTLTSAQAAVCEALAQDLAKDHPMNRLIEGDVGSGKTIVAAFAAALVAANGYQSIWMAPTDILARQHYKTTATLFEQLGYKVGMWTAKQKDSDPDSCALLIGTQALLSDKLPTAKRALVIVDEQHRFGVLQRSKLQEAARGALGKVPHFLSMTATPIPRTLAHALYGNLDVSIIDEKPANRKVIKTRVVPMGKRQTAYDFIRAHIERGEQAFVVCPQIDESSTQASPTLFSELERVSVLTEYDRLRKVVFPELHIGLLHGRQKSTEKQKTMALFNDGQIDILVSTSVVEVGIDVPNATIMSVEGANHFGLAQLHQLRGRVGRGAQQSFCFLFAEGSDEKGLERLRALEESDNGFRLAELDLGMRGPGELLGDNQSGAPAFRLAGMMDLALIERARQAAAKTIETGLMTKVLQDKLLIMQHSHME